MRDLCLGIAGLTIAIESDDAELELETSAAARRFLVRGDQPDVRIRASWGLPALVGGEPLFDSGGLWRLYRDRGSLRYQFTSPALGDAPYKVARFPVDFSRGEVGLRRLVPGARTADPLEYPLDELVLVSLLARGRGAEVHAAGIADRGRGLLLVGPSGAGKSTLTRLWLRTDALVLSDDRIVLRRGEDGLRMHGTPWHGEALLSSPESAPLSGVFFLVKAEENSLERVGPAAAASRLLAATFAPFHDAEGLDFTLGFLAEVVRSVPCFDLRFTPDARATDLLRAWA